MLKVNNKDNANGVAVLPVDSVVAAANETNFL